MRQKGFTLIELLIVIALLGVLALGLLATIDPFEQLKKGNDTSMRNMISEFYNAAIRYYAMTNQFPWGTITIVPGEGLGGNQTWITTLITAGELKQKFVELATQNRLNRITVYSPTTSELIVCFQPESKSFQKDPNTIFITTGQTGTDCKATGGSTNCYWCVQ